MDIGGVAGDPRRLLDRILGVGRAFLLPQTLPLPQGPAVVVAAVSCVQEQREVDELVWVRAADRPLARRSAAERGAWPA